MDLRTDLARATFEYRLRARDQRGRWHLARAVEGQFSHGLLNEVRVFDELRRDDIAELRFETRPVHWVEFRDVALYASTTALPRDRSR